MARFWKFNSFVGAVGLVLVIAAFYAGNHALDYEKARDIINVSVDWASTPVSLYLVSAGLIGLTWQVVMTCIGLLTGFFSGPRTR